MKIISGIYKGRKLDGFDIDGTRPTMDRVKESLFAMIQNNIKDSVLGAIFGKNKKDENINNIEKGINNNQQQMIPQKMNLIQLARAQYDLNGISDAQLQDAIEKSNGNIDDAIILLMS